MTFRAAAIQTLARLGDLDANLELVARLTKDAVLQGAELIVFPECMNTGYLFDSAGHARELAESLDGRFVRALADLSREHRVFIASGMTEWDPLREKIFNSGVLVDRSGTVAVHYHKQFLATHDQNWFAFGVNGCPVADTELGRIGLLICFDGRIPEIARCLALQGAEVLVDMANFFAMDQAEMWVPARAWENGVWIVAATKAGHERSIYYPGGSMIVDPTGRVRARMPYDRHGMVVQDVDPATARDKRIYARNDRIADRRPDAYRILGEPFDATPAAAIAKQSLVPAESAAKVGAVQIHVGDGVEIDAVIAQLSHAAKLGIHVLVLPEYVASRAWAPDAREARRLADTTETLLSSVGRVCATYRCYTVVSHVERTGATLYPTAFLVGPDGTVRGGYRKVHLTAEERGWATAGTEFPVFETEFGRLAVMLGYDGVFPEASRCLALAGADCILWPASMREAFERELVAVPRAADNRCFVVLANRLDSPYPGGSFVIPPGGFPLWDVNVVAPPTRALGAVMPAFADLAVARQKAMIPKVHMLANRLTDSYGPLLT
jgi:predicted amidohydrolase